MPFNNETLGISAESALCDIYNIENNINPSRVNQTFVNSLQNVINKFKEENAEIKINKHIGGLNGSKDFKYNNDLTLSLKTNKSKSGFK